MGTIWLKFKHKMEGNVPRETFLYKNNTERYFFENNSYYAIVIFLTVTRMEVRLMHIKHVQKG